MKLANVIIIIIHAIIPFAVVGGVERRRSHPNLRTSEAIVEAKVVEWDATSRRLAACDGAETSDKIKKGDGPRPTITWDVDNCAYDADLWNSMSAGQKADAYYNWAYYWTGAQALQFTQPEGVVAYKHYRDNVGTDLNVDYEKAIQEDTVIEKGVDDMIESVKTAAKELIDGEEESFEFHSTEDTGVDNGDSPNWRKTVGGHQIWSEGTVTFDEDACTLTVDFTIIVEDYYNFNPGQKSVEFGLPDDDNCLFEMIGWAKSFYSRGQITRSVVIDISCGACDAPSKSPSPTPAGSAPSTDRRRTPTTNPPTDGGSRRSSTTSTTSSTIRSTSSPRCSTTSATSSTIDSTTTGFATTTASEPWSTTDATDPWSTTDATNPWSTTDATDPWSTTDTTGPMPTTDATDPWSTTDATDPWSTTDATDPRSTTDSTYPWSTTDATDPWSTTDATDPWSTTEATELWSTTEATEPWSTTDATNLWE